ncbi:MAG: DUF6033 family protein [Oscillospiraceae bacterium]|nr:DUF6033 family protein [Oscillospiraceae bacterium]
MAINSVVSDYVKNTVKAQSGVNVWSNENTAKTDKESGLSTATKNYLAYLRDKFGDVNFVVGSAKDGASGGGKKYNCFIHEDLLEQMANDPETAAKYEKIIFEARAQVDELKEKVDESGLGKLVKSYGIEVDADGKVNYIVMLNDSIKGMYDKKPENSSGDKKNVDKSAEANGVPKSIKAGSIEELLEKLKEIAENRTEKANELYGGKDENKTNAKNTDVLEKDGEFKKPFISKPASNKKDGFDITAMLPKKEENHSAGIYGKKVK